jgi:protocatechuate 3,4-dioxygenase beta subunit
MRTFISTIDSQSRTDSNGVFRIDAIPLENRYRITIKADGYGQKRISFDTGDAVDGLLDLGQIELPLADMSVTGCVVDVTGNPVPGIQVYSAGEGQPSCRIKSDEQGYFALDGLCPGLVRFFAEGRLNDEGVACQVLTEAGASDVKVVVTENGYFRSRYIRTKSHEEIIKSGNPYIAGRVVDENGVAVTGVPVRVRCMQSKNEKGKDMESYFQIARFGDVTDKQGRFAIELKEEATYSLLFSPDNHAAMIVYDVVTDTGDLKVTLSSGGTLTGQLVRFNRGVKVPVPNTKVELKQANHSSYSHLVSDHEHKTVTDSQGRFRFERIRTLIRTDRQRQVYEPRTWELCSGDTSQSIRFLPGEKTKHIDLVLRPNIAKAPPLTSKALPDYTGINLDLNQDRFKDRKLLICFFDYEQRPARRYVLQLNGRQRQLREKGVRIVAVQTNKTSENKIAQWVKTTNISIPVATVIGDFDETRFIWNVQSLPWLILTDREHVVVAEGFNVNELDDKMTELREK